MRKTIVLAALVAVGFTACTIEPVADGGRTERSDRTERTEVDRTEDTELDLAEMDFTADDVVDLMVAQDPSVVENICTQAEDLSDEMLELLRPEMSQYLAEGAEPWGLEAEELYDAVLRECGR